MQARNIMVGLGLLLALSACTGVELAKTGDQAKPDSGDSESVADETFDRDGYRFDYPAGWRIKTERQTQPFETDIITIQDTDRRIALGAALPDDYFLATGDSVVNTAKYAPDYVLISIETYSAADFGNSFEQFLEINQGGAVATARRTTILDQPAVEFYEAEELTGAQPAARKLFAVANNRIYEFTLYSSASERDIGSSAFDRLISSFRF